MSTHRDNPTLNALRHGGAAQTLFLPTEDPQLFDRLLNDLFTLHQPSNSQDARLVYDSAEARWYLDRRSRVLANFEIHLHDQRPDTVFWSTNDLHTLNLFDRYKTQAERAFRRALTCVQTIRKQAVREEIWREQLAIQKQRIALDVQKFEFAQAKEARRNAEKDQKTGDPAGAADLIQKLDDFQATLAPIQHEPTLNCSVIVQRSFIRLDDEGKTFIDLLSPDDAEVRQIIETREKFANPPQCIVRDCTFLNGIPAEYEHLVPVGFSRTHAGRDCFRSTLTVDQFLVLADREDSQYQMQQPRYRDEETRSDEEWLAAQRSNRL